MVLLGLDIGEKRIGVAKSDELNMFSHSVGYIDRGTDTELIQKIRELIETYHPQKIVVGLPIKMDGTPGIASEKIKALVTTLKEQLTTPIDTWDERLTTKEAFRYMHDSSLSGSKKKKKVDALAAQIILQSYLDCNKERHNE